MADPVQPREPVPCEKCGAAMDPAPPPGGSELADEEVRLVCPRCNHESHR